jgi:membrane associated rhomboid family serine protease
MPVYGLTVVWALAGVIVVNIGDVPLVAGAAAVGAVVMLGALGLMWRRGARPGQIP